MSRRRKSGSGKVPLPVTSGRALGGNQVSYLSMSSFALNFAGLLQSLSDFKSKPFQPVFEALSNGMHAVEDLLRTERGAGIAGRVSVIIERDTTQMALDLESGRAPLMPIKSIKIKDNGIGFTDKNLEYFQELFSRHKYNRGGKGIGRLSYLKVFAECQIESVFFDEELERFRQRRFRCTAEEGIASHTILDTELTASGTTVTLRYLRSEYASALRKSHEAISRAIMEHFLVFFSSPNTSTKISLFDETIEGEEQVDLNEQFKNEVLEGIAEDSIDVEGNALTIRYLTARRAPGNANKVYLCANGREVNGKNLSQFIDQLPKQGGVGEDKTYILVCVTGEYLDNHVNYSRVGFDIPLRAETEDELGFGNISIEGIFEEVGKKAAEHLKPLTDNLTRRTRESLRDYVLQDKRRTAKFRPLIEDSKYDYILNRLDLPPNPKARDFELALIQAKNILEAEIRANTEEIYNRRPGDKGFTVDDMRRRHSEIVDSIDVLKQIDLVDYVVHRKIILEFLEKSLDWAREESESHYVEEAVHRIFHPLNTESSQVHPDFQNLWVIDERLTYHSYLASDKRLSSNKHTSSESSREPDIYLAFDQNYFDNPHAYRTTNDSPSIVIVEFKRPGKEGYKFADPDADPIEQCIQYVKNIRMGKRKSQVGRTIPNAVNIQYYAYVIIDFTESANQLLSSYVERSGFRSDFTQSRYFGYYPSLNLYVEAIDFTKLIDDAKSRSQYIFERLGIDEASIIR